MAVNEAKFGIKEVEIVFSHKPVSNYFVCENDVDTYWFNTISSDIKII